MIARLLRTAAGSPRGAIISLHDTKSPLAHLSHLAKGEGRSAKVYLGYGLYYTFLLRRPFLFK
jgi:hypothetical protein